MTEKEAVQIELSASEAKALRRHAKNRHNRIAEAQQEMFGEAAELSQTEDVSTRQAVSWVVRKELEEAK